jgi:hypothetical protein
VNANISPQRRLYRNGATQGSTNSQRHSLDATACRVYAQSVIGVPMIGFGSPNSLGGQPPSPHGSRHFLRPWSGVAPMGGAGRGALQAAMPQGSPVPSGRSSNPSGSAHPFGRGLAEVLPITRSMSRRLPCREELSLSNKCRGELNYIKFLSCAMKCFISELKIEFEEC